jgi:uncharacterized protein YcbX
MSAAVTGLSITPVKGTQLQAVERIELDDRGVRENRRFFLIDDQDVMVNATNLGALNAVISSYDEPQRRLTLRFPDGRVIEDEVRLGDEVTTSFYRQPMAAQLVLGDWSDVISGHVGKRLRLVEAGEDGAVDRGREGAVTLISRGSLEQLAQRAERPTVDVRRFRMLIEFDGVGPHEEDAWVGRTLSVGEAQLHARGHVGRCVITNRHPETGEIDLQTLKILGRYRKDAETTEPVAFGVYGEVLRPGTISLGDPITVDPG